MRRTGKPGASARQPAICVPFAILIGAGRGWLKSQGRRCSPAFPLSLALALGTTVAACAPGQVPTVAQASTETLQGLCKFDQLYQPVTVQVASGVIPLLNAAGAAGTGAALGANAAIAVDQTTIHPLIVQACQSLGGEAVASSTPAAATASPTTAAPATPAAPVPASGGQPAGS